MTLRFICSLLSCIGLAGTLAAQTNPAAQPVPCSENFSTLAATSTVYPAGIQGWKIGTSGSATFRTAAPTADQAMAASGDASSSAAGIYNYNGKIGFLSSGSLDPSICFSINTTGLNGITVNYDVMTIRNPYDGSSNTRINDVALQYRVGTSGTFSTITGYNYQNNTVTQTSATTTPQNLQSISLLLPAACDNQPVVQLRWVTQETSGSGSRPGFAFDNISLSSCTTNTSTWYYRSRQTGSWSVYSTWEASLNGSTGWTMACSAPTSAAAAVTIQSGHTVTINTNVTAPNLTVNGTLIFDNTARTVSVTDYVTVSASGTFITQASGTATHSMSIGGNIINNNVFDMSRNGTTLVCNVTFTKNGSQSVTGTGGTTRFNYIGLNMGTSGSNILDISSSNFAAATAFLHPAAASAANALQNGTLRLSGSFTFSGTFFKSGAFYNIPATAGIWINNPNVTINGTNDSYDVSGLLRISAGTFNAGTGASNSIRLLNGSSMIVSGGTVNISGRLQAYESTNTTAQVATYNQSGGTVTLSKAGVNTTTMPEFTLDLATDSLIMSGGTLIFHNQASTADDLLNRATSVISGGLVQIGDATTTSATSAGFYVESYGALPNFSIYPCSAVAKVVLATNLSIKGDITIGTATTLNNRYSGIQTYNITLTGNWINNGTFTSNNLRTVTFSGTTAQLISGTAAGTAFNNLTISNAAGVTLQQPASVNAVLTLGNGNLYTSTANLLSMGNNATVGTVNNSGFVYGPVAKTGSTDFIFPVGKDLEYRPIAVSTLSASETFTAEYFHSDPTAPYSGPPDPALARVDGCEYWMLTEAGGATATVNLSWDTYSCGVTSLPDMAVARWDYSAGSWQNEGNGGTTGSTAAGTVNTAAAETLFGPFTLASTNAAENPLPVELLDFSAVYDDPAVDLSWSTASETNNDYFEVQRSADGRDFQPAGRVNGAGNSVQTLHYADKDGSPLSGTSYYRLKQVDLDGRYKYSRIVNVTIAKAAFELVSSTAGNDALLLGFRCSGNCIVNIELYDLSGQKVYSVRQNLSEKTTISIPAEALGHGIYLLKAGNGTQQLSKKLFL